MSVKLMSAVWDLEVSSGAKLVLMALADRANEDGMCWPSRRDLTAKCSMSLNTLASHLKSLEEEGYIQREERHRDNGSQQSNNYHLVVAQILAPSPKIAPPPPQELGTPPPQNLGTLESSYEPSIEPSTSLEALSASANAANVLVTKKKRKLSGTQLALFQEFWEAFDYKRGKAEAADAWLDLKPFNSELVGAIMEGARREAEARPQMVAAGRTPKMAQGWLTARRWEDEPELFTRIGRQPPLSFKEQARLREEQQRRDTIRFNYEQGCEFCGEEL